MPIFYLYLNSSTPSESFMMAEISDVSEVEVELNSLFAVFLITLTPLRLGSALSPVFV